MNKSFQILAVIFMMFLGIIPHASGYPLVNVGEGAILHISEGSIVRINGSYSAGNSSATTINGNIQITGDWTNFGTQSSTAGRVVFLGSNYALVSGTGATGFYRIVLNKDTRNIVLQLGTALTDTDAFLVLQTGTFHVIGNYAWMNPFFVLDAGKIDIPESGVFILENANVNVSGQDADVILSGELKLASGTFNVGSDIYKRSIRYNGNDTVNTQMSVSSATVNIGGGMIPNVAGKVVRYRQTGGNVNVAVGGIADTALFALTANSVFRATDGTISLKNAASNAGINEFDLVAGVVGDTCSHSVLAIDPQTVTQNFDIASSVLLGSLTMIGTNSPTLMQKGNLTFADDITLAGTGNNRYSTNLHNLTLGGNFNFNLATIDGFSQGNNILYFTGNHLQHITSSTLNEIVLGNINVNKTGNKVLLDKGLIIDSDKALRLYGNKSVIDVGLSNLTFAVGSDVFAEETGTSSNGISEFSNAKYITSTQSDSLLGGRVVRKVASGTISTPLVCNFPIGFTKITTTGEVSDTTDVYTPSEIEIDAATVADNAGIGVKVIPYEHPSVEIQNRTIDMYWNVASENITLSANGAKLNTMQYGDATVNGIEGNYRVLLFSPAWNSATGKWFIDPGNSDNLVDINNDYFESASLNNINGDWTVGEQAAAKAIYYSRANGNYNDPITWSKIGFGGVASANAPSKGSDIVRVSGNTVTIAQNTPPVGKLSIESATGDREAGKLVFTGESTVIGDTFTLQAGTTISISSADGITSSGATGNVRTTVRKFGLSNYEYVGDATQTTGNGVPNTVAAIIVNKGNDAVVSLEQSTRVMDSLYIVNGILNLASATLNGDNPGRKLRMDGGELRIPSTFPLNYSTPSFTAGCINFTGTGSTTIPSNSTVPAVAQYNDLKIQSLGSEKRSGDVTFPLSGEIAINNNFDISELSFVSNDYGFQTDGSTVRFLKNLAGSVQTVGVMPKSASNAPYYLNGKLKYYNLTIDNAGTKQIEVNAGTADAYLTILNNLTITNGATFDSHGYDISVYGNWVNNGGTFVPGSESVQMISEVALLSTSINLQQTGENTVSNNFYDIRFTGPGIVSISDNITILNDLQIDLAAILSANDKTIDISGDWINNGGTFNYGTSNVRFVGSAAAQTISKTGGNNQFYNLILNNTFDVANNNNIVSASLTADTCGIIVNHDLNLNDCILASHVNNAYRYVKVVGNLTRTSGFVDGELRKNVVAGAVTDKLFEVGYNKVYTPVTMTFTGTGGTAGFIGVLSDGLSTISSPVSFEGTDLLPTNISPANSGIYSRNALHRQYRIIKPSSSTFTLGEGTRQYNLTVDFGTAISNNENYQAALLKPDNATWVKPLDYTSGTPYVNAIGTTSLTYNALKDLGTMICGDPAMLTFYSRVANGNWNDPATWSHQKYGGPAGNDYPGQITPYTVFIGSDTQYSTDGEGNPDTTLTKHVVNLNQDITVSENCLIYVDTLGTFMTGEYELAGQGAFNMLSGATLGVGSPDGITQTATTGNVQTAVRNYNGEGNAHNNSSFIYTGSASQTSGDGLPAKVTRLTIKTTNNSPVTMTSTVAVYDSLLVESGEMNLGTADLWLHGNMNVAGGGTFVPNGKTVYVRQDSLPVLISAISSPPGTNRELNFYDLNINKPLASGHFVLATNTNINVTNNLTFVADSNQVLIDAASNSTTTNTLYVRADNIVNAGQVSDDSTGFGGWINGELRKNVTAGVTTMTWETGTENYYAPFSIEYSTTGGTAGVLGGRSIQGKESHVLAGDPTEYPINESRYVDVHWRLTKPATSSFERGNRLANYIVKFKIPELTTKLYCFDCADVAFWNGANWQGMPATNKYGNATWNTTNWASADTCSAGRENQEYNGFPNFTYEGDSCSTNNILGSIKVLATNTAYGTTALSDGSGTLLADFVAGNRNEIIYYTFYSRQDGDWSDPATWSTVDFTSNVNAALDAINNNTADARVTAFPSRKYDNVIIGNGHKVKLDVNVGANDNSPVDYFGPTCRVMADGTLDLGTSVFRGSQFITEKGATLIIGANDGISASNKSNYSGNVQLSYYTVSPIFADSINVIYQPTGRTSNGMTRSSVDRNSQQYYITRTRIYDNTTGSDVLDYTSGSNYLATNYGHQRSMKSCDLTVGHNYTVYTTTHFTYDGAAIIYNAVWLDTTFTGRTWYQASTNSYNYSRWNYRHRNDVERNVGAFTVPATWNSGTTILRVGMSYNTTLADRTDTYFIDQVWTSYAMSKGIGEFEDYTVNIINPNYTANQVCGSGLPQIVNNFTLESHNAASTKSNLTIGKNVTVAGDFQIKSGQFRQNRTDTLRLYGDFHIDTLKGYNPDKYATDYKLYRPYAVFGGPVAFIGSATQSISAVAGDTLFFNKLKIRKTGNAELLVNADVAVSSKLNLASNNNLVVADDHYIILGPYCYLYGDTANLANTFTNKRMIKLCGDKTKNSKVIKDMVAYAPDYTDTRVNVYDNPLMKPVKYIKNIMINGIMIRPTGDNDNGFVGNSGTSGSFGPTNGYQDFTTSYYTGNYSITLNKGTTYTFTFNQNISSEPGWYYVYLDFFGDGFTEDEIIGFGSGRNTTQDISVTIPNIPLNNVQTRMRVKLADNTRRDDPNQKETYVTTSNNTIKRVPTGGEAEDYLVTITGGNDIPQPVTGQDYYVVYDTVKTCDSSRIDINPYSYPTSSSGSSGLNPYVSSITFNEMDHNTDNARYKFYLGDTLTLIAGSNNLMYLNLSGYNTARYYASFWVDTDHNGAFPTRESNYDDKRLFGQYAVNERNVNILATNVKIPETAFNGNTRMRIKVLLASAGDAGYKPNSFDAAQTLDFPVRIIGGRDPYPSTFTPVADTMYKFYPRIYLAVDTARVYPQTKDILFPIGTDTVYNPARFYLSNKSYDTASTNTADISVKLIDGQHPMKKTDNCLQKYWIVETNNLSVPDDDPNDTLCFRYSVADVVGDTSKYIPARWREDESKWNIDLGTGPYAKSSPIRISNESGLEGEWTAGEPEVYFYYRMYYSRKSGSWNEPTNWAVDSVLKHLGKPAAYFPGELYHDDIVHIDGHEITFTDSLHIMVDSVNIGGTNPVQNLPASYTGTNNNTDQGKLVFGNTNSPLSGNKVMEVRSLQLSSDDGTILTATDGVNIADTIKINSNLNNLSNSSGGVFLKNNTNSVYLKFDGTDTNTTNRNRTDSLSVITGEGTWGNLADIFVTKDGGLRDTLYVNSSSFNLATATADNFAFYLNGGIVKNMIADDPLWLSSNNNQIAMGLNSGIVAVTGTTATAGTVKTNAYTTLYVNGGALKIGNDKNEHLLYQTGTKINVGDATGVTGTLNVAGGFARNGSNSQIDLTIGNGGLFSVNNIENTEIIGFDIPNATSNFVMSGGRVVVANAAGTTGQQADFRVNSGTMTGGTIQLGDSTLTPDGTLIKFQGAMPIYDLHLANNSTATVTSESDESITVIKHDWLIDSGHRFDLIGNTVNLGGNLTNYGTFGAVPNVATNNVWEIKLNGNDTYGRTDQTLASTSDLNFYSLTLDKSAGDVILANSASFITDIVINNRLEFTATNQAIINAQGPSSDLFVQMSPLVVGGVSVTTPQLFRLGMGHVYGKFRNRVEDDLLATVFPIGGNTNLLYRPLTIQPENTGNTAGLLEAAVFDELHPAHAQTPKYFVESKLMNEYWTLNPVAGDPFAVVGDNTYKLKLEFLSGDIRSGASYANLEQFEYSPRYTAPNSGLWYKTTTEARTSVSVTSAGNKRWGDFVISELESTPFYSKNDGDWNSISTWVTDSYESTNNSQNRIPDQSSDVVYIGNGKKVTVPSGLIPKVKSLTVETYHALPGSLIIRGQNGRISCENFTLADSCTIETENMYGFSPAGTNSGSVIAGNSSYGISRYIYSGKSGSQMSGSALPDSILTLIMNNSSATQNRGLYVYNNVDFADICVKDTLLLSQGELIPGSRGLKIKNCFILDNTAGGNDGYLNPLDSKFTFSNPSTYLIIRNDSGVCFNNVAVDKNSNVLATAPQATRTAINKVIKVNNELKFIGTGLNYSYFTLGDSVSLRMMKNGTEVFTGAGSAQFVVTSKNSGYVSQLINAPATPFVYPVGSNDYGEYHYGAIEFTASQGTSNSTFLGVSTNWGSQAAPMQDAHIGMRVETTANYIKRYWTVGEVSDGLTGQLKLHYSQSDILNSADEDKLDRIARWDSLREKNPARWTLFTAGTGADDAKIDITNNYVVTTSSLTSDELFGDWAFAQSKVFRRIFYSLTNGSWNSDQSWTFNPDYSAPIAGTGLFPDAVGDSVVIGNSKEITMTENAFSASTANDVGVQVGTSTTDIGILNLNNYKLYGSTFTLNQGSMLKIGSPDGINALATAYALKGNVLTTGTRTFSEGADYTYNGTSSQVVGNALPVTVRNLRVANTGTDNDNIVGINRNQSVSGNMIVQSGKADIATNILTATGSASTLEVDDSAYLRIGGNMNASTSLIDFTSFNIDENGWFDFYGDNQDISLVPLLLFNYSNAAGNGFGNVKLTYTGTNPTKTNFSVSQHIKLRGNLYVDPLAKVTVNDNIKSLEVIKNINNGGEVYNKGMIEVGQ